jgi:hypothetical protein
MELWINLISQFGFPIVAVLAMGAFIWVIYKRSEVREDKLAEELSKSQDINAKAIETLAVYNERLGNIETDVKAIKDNIIQGE